MAFQPYTDPDYAYPGVAQDLGGNLGDASTLIETAPGSRLAVYQVGDFAYPSLVPIPHVELTLFTFATGTAAITVYRSAGRRTMPVRGQIGVSAVGGRNVVDWEAPFGIPLTYRAEQFDSAGISLGFTDPFTTRLDVADDWVQNPFDPANGVRVQMLTTAGATISRPAQTDTYWGSGSGVAVGISQQRHALTDVDASFATITEDDADTVRNMFGDPYQSPSVPPVIVIRTGAGRNLRFPQPFFALIPDPVETPLDTQQGGSATSWQCTATEVASPAPALVTSVLTYADLDFTYSTYAAMDAAYSSYLTRDRDYTIAGAADGA